ncbi:hypothetical protein ACIA8K_04875 [Catenuloplanes sp. NPDC051500]|uniref:hypothetical protein n=1 Tax=Catenuloplanes sp. NPDC051500 TaxID=3363959 RepID=UPI0037B3DC49
MVAVASEEFGFEEDESEQTGEIVLLVPHDESETTGEIVLRTAQARTEPDTALDDGTGPDAATGPSDEAAPDEVDVSEPGTGTTEPPHAAPSAGNALTGASGVHPVLTTASGSYPVVRRPTGAYPVLREPTGGYPVINSALTGASGAYLSLNGNSAAYAALNRASGAYPVVAADEDGRAVGAARVIGPPRRFVGSAAADISAKQAVLRRSDAWLALAIVAVAAVVIVLVAYAVATTLNPSAGEQVVQPPAATANATGAPAADVAENAAVPESGLGAAARTTGTGPAPNAQPAANSRTTGDG